MKKEERGKEKEERRKKTQEKRRKREKTRKESSTYDADGLRRGPMIQASPPSRGGCA